MDHLSWSIHSKGHCKPVFSSVDTVNPHRVARMQITMDQSSSERCKIQKFIMNPSSTHIFSLNECNWISFHRLHFLVKKNGANDDKEKRANQPSLKKSTSDFSLTKVINFLKKKNGSRAKSRNQKSRKIFDLFSLFHYLSKILFSLTCWADHTQISICCFKPKKQLLFVFFTKSRFFFTRATLRRQKSVFASERWNSSKVLRGRKYFSPEYL